MNLNGNPYWLIQIGPVFTPEQCQNIINVGHQQKTQEAKVGGKTGIKDGKYDTKMRITTISWIPFKALPEMYKTIERTMQASQRQSLWL